MLDPALTCHTDMRAHIHEERAAHCSHIRPARAIPIYVRTYSLGENVEQGTPPPRVRAYTSVAYLGQALVEDGADICVINEGAPLCQEAGAIDLLAPEVVNVVVQLDVVQPRRNLLRVPLRNPLRVQPLQLLLRVLERLKGKIRAAWNEL